MYDEDENNNDNQSSEIFIVDQTYDFVFDKKLGIYASVRNTDNSGG